MLSKAGVAAGCAVAWLVLASRGSAQTFVGGDRCANCHGDASDKQQQVHGGALAQVDQQDGPKWAAALGVATRSPACLKCHGPDNPTDPQTVSCETCHGPASAYDRPHRRANFYDGLDDGTVQKDGLVNYFRRPRAVAEGCLRCHVLDAADAGDAAVLRAGHPNFPKFNLVQSLQKIDHFEDPRVKTRKRDYYPGFASQVAEAGAPLIAVRVAVVTPKPSPRADAGPRVGSSSDTGTKPPPMVLRSQPASIDRAPELMASPRPARPSAPPPMPGSPLPSASVPSPPSPTPGTAVDDGVTVPPDAGPLSTVELRGALVRRLAGRVKQGRRLESSVAPSPPVQFEGPDGDLLAIQDEALCLALEVLSGQRCPEE
jgi:hypothetical protein